MAAVADPSIFDIVVLPGTYTFGAGARRRRLQEMA
jgi:hypothetical protein